MQLRKFGRTNWQVSEIGYGMWGASGWKGSEDSQSEKSLDLAVERGVNFFDTAWGYGEGHSEQLLGKLVQRHQSKKIYVATKIPPMNFKWPSKKSYSLDECFPADHIKKYTETSLKNLGLEKIDLMQFHVWEDAWAFDDRWQRAVEDLQKEGKVDAWGISVNRWEPENCLNTLKTGLIDSVQVIYNIFDQAPEDVLFPLCKKLGIATIARVPFDEGTLTGNITKDTTFDEGDWRASYFVPENLIASAEHADLLRPFVTKEMSMAELALRFILMNDDVSTTIPGMRKERNVLANTAVSDGTRLDADMYNVLKKHRWDREPTAWSQ
ncbi:aldo/keto reductase [uncultured Cytophaga sp.]|uniref:aldo/keto reductase n=1 Tax=uncultured Cytophaga sp. TaxID=160238 RepID=UPI00260244CD|nr:aldo/keto reductase [uncultured Cytophaga sp.]